MNARILLQKRRTRRANADAGQKRTTGAGTFFETHKASAAHEVHACMSTTMTTSNVCPMCEAVFFSNLATARVRVVQGFSNEKLFYESARPHEWEDKKETEAPFFRATTQSARPFFKTISKHVKHEHLSTWSPSAQVHTRREQKTLESQRNCSNSNNSKFGPNMSIVESYFVFRRAAVLRLANTGRQRKAARSRGAHSSKCTTKAPKKPEKRKAWRQKRRTWRFRCKRR